MEQASHLDAVGPVQAGSWRAEAAMEIEMGRFPISLKTLKIWAVLSGSGLAWDVHVPGTHPSTIHIQGKKDLQVDLTGVRRY